MKSLTNLSEIGFYTLSDYRVTQQSDKSPLWRCELILTDRCNFKCPYCRGLRKDISGTLDFSDAMNTLVHWCQHGLKNIRFSGGEPTLYKGLDKLILYCKRKGVERIAVSTNGSATMKVYNHLIRCGVNDFSISLDACCASVGDKMAGGIVGAWEKVIENIKEISKKVYTTVGVVVNEENVELCNDTILFADSLGVSDIRVIPSAQYGKLLTVMRKIPSFILKKYPILRYRVNHIKMGRNVRGITENDSKRCSLVLDDMAVAGKYHFPCIIYMREGGNPIGNVCSDMRKQRKEWSDTHDCFADPICKKNCLDVCIDFNNKADKSITH